MKHSEGTTFIVEPFSMYLPWVLRDDLYRLPANEAALRCRCRACYLCDLRDAVRHGRISFKETSLFEYLDILAEDFDIQKIVYVERDRDQVAESYAKHDLWRLWRLGERRLARELSGHVRAADLASRSRAYGAVATDLKRFYWHGQVSTFSVMHVSFAALTEQPAETVRTIFDFLDLKPLPYLDALIERKFREGAGAHVYSTFHDPLR